MSAGMRPCAACGRHARTDETRCPFCGAELGLLHALPVVPMGIERPAPKYGGPPYARPIGCALVVFGLFVLAGAVAAVALLLR